MQKVKLLVIGGVTAAGKSELAVELAERFNGEVINADSVQIYRELNIGSAKPKRELRERVKHHLFDVATIKDPWDAKRFENEALKAVEEIWQSGKLPIAVGGSGFYIKALIFGMPDGIPKSEELRKKLSQRKSQNLYEELRKIDPQRAQKIHPNDKKRIIRALEIFYLTGKKPSLFDFKEEERFDALKIAITRAPEDLKRRIYERVDKMMEEGFLEETKKLAEIFGFDNRILTSTLGYRELLEHLKGKISLEEAVKLIKKRTWLYAKRQVKWFKKEGFIFFTLPEEKDKIFEAVGTWLYDKNNRREG